MAELLTSALTLWQTLHEVKIKMDNQIHEIVLYTCSHENPVECHEIRAWIERSNIEYIDLYYAEKENAVMAINAVNTWWHGEKTITKWPFVTLKHFAPDGQIIVDFIEGAENIKQQLPAIYAIKR